MQLGRVFGSHASIHLPAKELTSPLSSQGLFISFIFPVHCYLIRVNSFKCTLIYGVCRCVSCLPLKNLSKTKVLCSLIGAFPSQILFQRRQHGTAFADRQPLSLPHAPFSRNSSFSWADSRASGWKAPLYPQTPFLSTCGPFRCGCCCKRMG